MSILCTVNTSGVVVIVHAALEGPPVRHDVVSTQSIIFWFLAAAVDYALIRIIALFPISVGVRTSLPVAPAYFEIVSRKRGKRTR